MNLAVFLREAGVLTEDAMDIFNKQSFLPW
jgi:hypothetical protein